MADDGVASQAVIPRILFRTVPVATSAEVEGWWRRACELHPGWDCRTYRDPIDTTLFPISSPHWDRCGSGAQRAGLIRLEALLHHGGFYLDSDIEVFRSLEPLRHARGVAAWEDDRCVPDAFLAAHAGDPVVERMLRMAIETLDEGAWASGPGVTTHVLPSVPDWLLLPPASIYPYHYTAKHLRGQGETWPFCFAAHHWHHSWAGA